MTPVTPVVPDVHNCEYGKNQAGYIPLPAIGVRGRVLSRWRFTEEERQLIASGADLFLSQLTFGSLLQPVQLRVSLDPAAVLKQATEDETPPTEDEDAHS